MEQDLTINDYQKQISKLRKDRQKITKKIEAFEGHEFDPLSTLYHERWRITSNMHQLNIKMYRQLETEVNNVVVANRKILRKKQINKFFIHHKYEYSYTLINAKKLKQLTRDWNKQRRNYDLEFTNPYCYHRLCDQLVEQMEDISNNFITVEQAKLKEINKESKN
jgi:hypothetical protein